MLPIWLPSAMPAMQGLADGPFRPCRFRFPHGVSLRAMHRREVFDLRTSNETGSLAAEVGWLQQRRPLPPAGMKWTHRPRSWASRSTTG